MIGRGEDVDGEGAAAMSEGDVACRKESSSSATLTPLRLRDLAFLLLTPHPTIHLHHPSPHTSQSTLRNLALCSAHLDKANEVSLLTEALTADVEAVLADDTSVVAADAARARALAELTGVAEPDGGVGHLD